MPATYIIEKSSCRSLLWSSLLYLCAHGSMLMPSSMVSLRKHRLRSLPDHNWTAMMPNMKNTKKHNMRTLPSIGRVSNSNITRIRRPITTHLHIHLYIGCQDLVVPTPTLVGREELYTQLGFFCSVNFGRSIYSS